MDISILMLLDQEAFTSTVLPEIYVSMEVLFSYYRSWHYFPFIQVSFLLKAEILTCRNGSAWLWK